MAQEQIFQRGEEGGKLCSEKVGILHPGIVKLSPKYSSLVKSEKVKNKASILHPSGSLEDPSSATSAQAPYSPDPTPRAEVVAPRLLSRLLQPC